MITALDGEPVKTMPVLVARLRNYRAGDTAAITVDRGGEAVDLEITLGVPSLGPKHSPRKPSGRIRPPHCSEPYI